MGPTLRGAIGFGIGLALAAGCGPSGRPAESHSPRPRSVPIEAQAPMHPAGLIAFSEEVGGNEDIYLFDLTTRKATRLTSSPAREFDPDISPDGRRIVYRRNPNPDSDHADIWLMEFDGSRKRNLTRAPEHDNWSPAWSPDGSRIAFASTREGGTLSLWTMAADGGDLRRVTEDHGEYPDWSPDGRWLVYAAPLGGGGSYDLWIVPAEGGEPRRLTSWAGTEFHPAWSPDGSAIAYQMQQGEAWTIHVVRPDGSGDRKVSAGEGTGPFWSPDGLLAWEGPGGWMVTKPPRAGEPTALGRGGRLASWTA